MITVVLVEQALTVLLLWLGGDVPPVARHVLVPAVSAFTLVAALGLVALIRDLHRKATLDPLTGAMNRSGFERCLRERDRARRTFGLKARRVLVAFDLDGFKGVNDAFGHAAGDGVLQEIVRRMKGAAPRGSKIGRLGGDEFALELRLCGSLSAMGVVEAIRTSLVAQPIVVDGVAHRIGVTAGAASREEGEPIEALMTRADLALVAGKLHGKNRSYEARSTVRSAIVSDPEAERPTVRKRVT